MLMERVSPRRTGEENRGWAEGRRRFQHEHRLVGGTASARRCKQVAQFGCQLPVSADAAAAHEHRVAQRAGQKLVTSNTAG